MAAFRKALAGRGFVEGRNVAVEYRWASGAYDRLPKLAAELVGRHISYRIDQTEPDASGRVISAITSSSWGWARSAAA